VIAAIAAIAVAFFGIIQWAGTTVQTRDKDLKDRADERRKEVEAQDKDLKDKAEARFQIAVTALGDEKEGVKIGGAILLRTFLRPGYEQFYDAIPNVV